MVHLGEFVFVPWRAEGVFVVEDQVCVNDSLVMGKFVSQGEAMGFWTLEWVFGGIIGVPYLVEFWRSFGRMKDVLVGE